MMVDEDKEVLLNNNSVTKRTSNLILKITEIDQSFFDLVESGFVIDVKNFLEENLDFDVNCEDFKGQTALNIAVRNENKEMVTTLLSYEATKINDSHLHAVKAGNIDILVIILDRLRSLGPGYEEGPSQGYPCEYSKDMTPLMLACHIGDFEIIQLLLQRGHRINELESHCSCKLYCRYMLLTEDIEYCKHRYNAFKARASPAYICLTSRDPVLKIFQLYHQIENCLQCKFYKEYEDLLNNLKTFAVELVNLCHTSEEVEAMLNVREGFIGIGGRIQFPRVRLAMLYRQKEFVAHPNVQQVLRRTWFGECHAFVSHNRLTMVLSWAGFSFCIPLAILSYFIIPKSTLGKVWASPIARFAGYLISYAVFMICVYVHTNVNKDEGKAPSPSGTTFVIVIWITGFVLRDVVKFLIRGPKYLMISKWFIIDVGTELIFILAFVCWIVSYIKTKEHDDEFAERKTWSALEPTLLGEACFAVGCIFAMTRLLSIFQLSPNLGPLLISLEKMSYEILRLATPFMVILISFASALHYLYWYYGENQNVSKIESFISFRHALKNLFWTLFGSVPLEVADIVTSSLNDTVGSHSHVAYSKHWFTEEIGYFLFGVYNVIAVLLFMNMVVACMTARMDKVLANADTEWKFSQSLLWFDFFDEVNVLPVPLNLLGLPWIFGIICRQYCFQSHLGTVKCNCTQCCYLVLREEDIDEYIQVLHKVIQRYLHKMSSAVK